MRTQHIISNHFLVSECHQYKQLRSRVGMVLLLHTTTLRMYRLHNIMGFLMRTILPLQATMQVIHINLTMDMVPMKVCFIIMAMIAGTTGGDMVVDTEMIEEADIMAVVEMAEEGALIMVVAVAGE